MERNSRDPPLGKWPASAGASPGLSGALDVLTELVGMQSRAGCCPGDRVTSGSVASFGASEGDLRGTQETNKSLRPITC